MRYKYVPKIAIHEHFKIVAMVCYLLEKQGALSEDLLTDALGEGEIVGVIELKSAIGTVERKKLAVLDKDTDKYNITSEGRNLVKVSAQSLPMLSRTRAVKNCEHFKEIEELRRTASWNVGKTKDGGFAFSLRLFNEMNGADMLTFSLSAPDEDTAKDMQRRFLARSGDILQQMIALFTSDSANND